MATSLTPTLDQKLVAIRCLEAWSSGDFEAARALLDRHVQFRGPLGNTEGIEEYIDRVRELVPSIRSVQHRCIFGEGDDVCIVYDLTTKTTPGSVRMADWYRVRHGRVLSINAFFDARALVPERPAASIRSKPSG
jgi:hypothetical protein